MESFFANYWEVVSAIFSGAFIILWYFIKTKLAKVDEIEKNYIQKFQDIKDDSANKFETLRVENQRMHLEVLSAIATINVNIADLRGKVDAQTNKCSFIQDQKHNKQN